MHDDLQALIELLVEHLVGVGGVCERGLVGDDEGGVQLAGLNVPQQLIPVLLAWGLACPKRQALLHERTNHEVVAGGSVDSHNGHDASLQAQHLGLRTETLRRD